MAQEAKREPKQHDTKHDTTNKQYATHGLPWFPSWSSPFVRALLLCFSVTIQYAVAAAVIAAASLHYNIDALLLPRQPLFLVLPSP